MLHCVVVGGGPTGVEFSGELSDFIMKDVRQRYAHVKDDIRVTLIEVTFIDINLSLLFIKYNFDKYYFSWKARDILSSFDDGLRQYAIKQLNKVNKMPTLILFYL